MNTRDERFPLFDSLRAIAALSVLVFHVSFAPGAMELFGSMVAYVKRLDIGVTIFFLISGFLLYRPFARAHLAGERAPEAGPYAWRRFLRIVPGYWVALTAVTIWIGLGGVFTFGGIVTYYGFGQIYRDETFAGGILQAWTLGVEVAFYAFLPVYAFVIRRFARGREDRRLPAEIGGLALVALAGVAWNLLVLARWDASTAGITPWLFAPPAFLHQFAAGMALAVASVVLWNRERRPVAVRIVERLPSIPWLAAAAAFVLLAVGIGLDEGPVTDQEWLLRSLLSTVVAFGLLLPAVFGDDRRGLVRRFLGNRVLLYLGVVSYGVYLYHVAVIKQLRDWGLTGIGDDPESLIAWTLLVTAGTTLIATVSWRLVEKPALRLKSRIRPRQARAQAAAPAEAATAAPSPASR